jgi:hypothetical protein
MGLITNGGGCSTFYCFDLTGVFLEKYEIIKYLHSCALFER